MPKHLTAFVLQFPSLYKVTTLAGFSIILAIMPNDLPAATFELDWTELFSSSKHMTNNWPVCVYRVRRGETTPSRAVLY